MSCKSQGGIGRLARVGTGFRLEADPLFSSIQQFHGPDQDVCIFSGRCEGGAAAPLGGAGMTGLGRPGRGGAGNALPAQENSKSHNLCKADTRAQWSIQKAQRANAGCPNGAAAPLGGGNKKTGGGSGLRLFEKNSSDCSAPRGFLPADAPEDECGADADKGPGGGFGDVFHLDGIDEHSRGCGRASDTKIGGGHRCRFGGGKTRGGVGGIVGQNRIRWIDIEGQSVVQRSRNEIPFDHSFVWGIERQNRAAIYSRTGGGGAVNAELEASAFGGVA